MNIRVIYIVLTGRIVNAAFTLSCLESSNLEKLVTLNSTIRKITIMDFKYKYQFTIRPD